jgi:hypothetical protein
MFALRLVHPRNQWIPIQAHSKFDAMPPSPKRKRDDESRIEFMGMLVFYMFFL